MHANLILYYAVILSLGDIADFLKDFESENSMVDRYRFTIPKMFPRDIAYKSNKNLIFTKFYK